MASNVFCSRAPVPALNECINRSLNEFFNFILINASTFPSTKNDLIKFALKIATRIKNDFNENNEAAECKLHKVFGFSFPNKHASISFSANYAYIHTEPKALFSDAKLHFFS